MEPLEAVATSGLLISAICIALIILVGIPRYTYEYLVPILDKHGINPDYSVAIGVILDAWVILTIVFWSFRS